MITQTANDTQQPAQQHRQTKQRAKAQAKAHIGQPSQRPARADDAITVFATIAGWLLLPILIGCMAIYKWRVWRANMGYRRLE